ncbi:hypothetical protein [Streptomyces sp. NPDC059076]|uniref:hypothetical protein n=1 Tax=unclassified Streptomyces TaxID=2593676 RepID=UPI0036815721
MSDLDYRRMFFAYLSRHLQDEGYGTKWPRELSLAVGVVQAVGTVLSRKEFEEVIRAVSAAVARMERGPHPMLPHTLVSHLYDGRRAQFGGHPLPCIALAGHLLGTLHESLPAQTFQDLLTGLTQTVDRMTADERRQRYLRTVG